MKDNAGIDTGKEMKYLENGVELISRIRQHKARLEYLKKNKDNKYMPNNLKMELSKNEDIVKELTERYNETYGK